MATTYKILRVERDLTQQDVERLTEPPAPGQRLYSLAQAGLYLGRSLYSVRTLIWRGLLPVVSEGRTQRVDIKDLEHFIEVHKRTIQ